MSLDSINGSSRATGSFKPKAAPAQAPATPAPAAKPAATTDRLSTSAASARSQAYGDPAQEFDVSDAAERLIAAHGGSLEMAYYESIGIRNAKKNAPGYAKELADYSKKLGYDRNLTPDEMRDVEHFMYAAAYVSDQGKADRDAGLAGKSWATLKREPHAVVMGILTMGYSAAKAVNKVMPDGLKFLKSRTAPSLDEVSAGLKGTWRGLRE